MCSPKAGAGRVGSPGVRLSLIGTPSWRTGPKRGLVDLDHHLPRPDQLRVERLVDVEDRLDAAVVLVVEGSPLLARAAPEDLGDLAPAVRARRVELALDQVGPLDTVAEGGPELRLERAAADPAVGRLVGHVAGEAAGELLLAAARHLAVAEVAPGDQRQPGEGAVGHRDVDVLALAGAAALVQGGHHPEGGHQGAAAEVRDLAARLNRRPVLGTGQAEQPDQPQVVHVVAGPLDVGAVLAVAGDRADDDRRVGLAHPLVADAEAVEHTGPEAVEDDVVSLHQPQQGLPPAVRFEIEPHGALAAVEGEVERRARARRLVGVIAVVGRRPADVVAHPGVLDLEHLGAEVGEQQRAEAAGQQSGEVEDPDVGERQLGAHAGSTPTGNSTELAMKQSSWERRWSSSIASGSGGSPAQRTVGRRVAEVKRLPSRTASASSS